MRITLYWNKTDFSIHSRMITPALAEVYRQVKEILNKERVEAKINWRSGAVTKINGRKITEYQDMELTEISESIAKNVISFQKGLDINYI